jgi:ubiquinone biosynthesis protein
MKLSFKTQHLTRYREIARLLYRYGRADVFESFGFEHDASEPRPRPNGGPNPDELASDLETMGPTFIKLGQVLSTRSDLLPEPYLRALSRLQDKVQPFPYQEVERIVQAELGARISKAFAEFDPAPLAAASLAQVHMARLRNWRHVVVKVQRPNVRKQIAEDLEILDQVATFISEHTDFGRRYQVCRILDEFRRTLVQELDYRREAANMVAIRANLAEFPHVRIPAPIEDYTTGTVLTMDYVRGTKVTDLSRVVRTELDGGALADELFRAYLKQVLVDGLFHADPHPGNVLLTEDGCVGLLDLGMVGRVSPEMQGKLLKLLLAISEGRSEDAATLAIETSQTGAHFDENEFRRKIGHLVAEQQHATLQQVDIGKGILELAHTAGQTGLFVPTQLSMLGKTLLQIQEIGRELDPSFNPNAAIRRHSAELLNQRVQKDLAPHHVFASMLEMKDFLGHLPVKLNRILDSVANAELEIRVKSPEVNVLMDGFQKVANRITSGLVLASLIVGASLLMQVPTSFQLFGYPGLAMLFFLFAAGMGFWLVLSIMIRDYKTKRDQD